MSEPAARPSVVVVPPDASWPARAEAEAAALRALLGRAVVDVHHVGSTSAPGLRAKPILDLLPVAASLAAIDAARPALEAAGWTWRGEHGIAGRRYLRRGDEGAGTAVHAHVFEADHPEVARHLAFRDLLRRDAAVRDAYAALERELAARLAGDADRSRYQDGKAEFIELHTRAALRASSMAAPGDAAPDI